MQVTRRQVLGSALVAGALATRQARATAPAVRVGALQQGSVAWVLDVVRTHRLDERNGAAIETVALAGGPAAQLALQGGRVDVIVNDWFWVSRRRRDGADLTFSPFSSAVGDLVVPRGSPIRGLRDLQGKRLGVAGSALDKSWLVLRAAARRSVGFDPASATEASYGAPSLLLEALRAGRLDAGLLYWQFAVRAETDGMRSVLTVEDMMADLGLRRRMPMTGWVFSTRWAAGARPALDGFLRAAREAEAILASSDAEWQRIAPLTGARDAAELGRLRDRFRAGVPGPGSPSDVEAAQHLLSELAGVGGRELVGPDATLAAGTFWEVTAS